MARILQLKISLKGITPPIWRRVLVEDSIKFNKLHTIIQGAMGWGNYHLYEFDASGLRISEPSEDDYEKIVDSKKIKLSELLKTEKQKIKYTYDFGDDWEHLIVLEKILEKEGSKKYPACIDGKRACPPEDCGGVWGYEELLEIRKDKKHPEYKEKIVDWLGEDFDPEYFDIKETDESL